MVLAGQKRPTESPEKKRIRLLGPGGGFGVGIYARVSTPKQDPGMQLAACRDYCNRRDWTILASVSDVACGGAKRAQKEHLMRMARRREIAAIVVWKLDRWGRSLSDVATSLAELVALEVAFVSLTEGMDLSTPGGRMQAGIFAVLAEWEREIIRERVQAGMDRAREQGTHVGRPPSPPWLRAAVVNDRAKGISVAKIAHSQGIGENTVRRILAREFDSKAPR
jgi:DNA invertase Pin-like site-specific DNA recombinase